MWDSLALLPIHRLVGIVIAAVSLASGRRMLPSGMYEPEPDPGSYPEQAEAEVSWLQPMPDAMVYPGVG
jgi:hypothetical protein